MAPPDFNAEPTRINGYVKNLLGDPVRLEKILDTLTYEQKIGLAIIKLSESFDTLQTSGCPMGQRLQSWYYKVIGGMAALGMVSGVIYLTITLVSFFRQGRE